MPEVIEEYVQILISKNTYERLTELAELVEPVPSATCDAVIGRMLINLDYLTDSDKVMFLDFGERAFQILSIAEFIQKHKTKSKKKGAVKEE